MQNLTQHLETDKSSLLDFLPHPSAIFDGIETAHLVICDIKPNRSSDGKPFVNSKIILQISMPAFQTFSSLKLCIKNPNYLILGENELVNTPLEKLIVLIG